MTFFPDCDYHEDKRRVVVKKRGDKSFFICEICQLETAEEKLHYFIEYNGGIIPSAPWEFRRIMFTTKLSYEEVRSFYAQKMDEFFPPGDNNNEKSEEMGEKFEDYELEDFESDIDSLPDLDGNLSNLDQESENFGQDWDSVDPVLNKNKTESNPNNNLPP